MILVRMIVVMPVAAAVGDAIMATVGIVVVGAITVGMTVAVVDETAIMTVGIVATVGDEVAEVIGKSTAVAGAGTMNVGFKRQPCTLL